MTRTKIAHLVGRDIAGRKAITTQPEHDYLFEREGGLRIDTLIKAEWKQTRGARYLYLYYEKQGMSCGYSGWREDHQGSPVVRFVEP